MTDVVSPSKRSQMMSGIRSKNTLPELIVRRGLHARGFRYRLHDRKLPGKPDLVFPRFRSVILVHGCFWHGHQCHLFRMPSTRTEFWERKIGRNRERDAEVKAALLSLGWRVLEVWECELRAARNSDYVPIVDRIAEWLSLSASEAGSKVWKVSGSTLQQ